MQTESRAQQSDRFRARFSELAQRNEGMLMPFVPIGFPTLSATIELVDGLVAAGADAVELGFPYSDPIADGPILQQAAAHALEEGATTSTCFEIVAAIRQRHPALPIAILTYLNLVETPGAACFFQQAANAGIDAAVLADLPCCEAGPYVICAREAGVHLVRLVAPDTPRSTLRQIADLGGGFTYVVARRGITGTRDGTPELCDETLTTLREWDAPPALVGFGLSQAAHLEAVMKAGAHGGIVGSAFVSQLQSAGAPAALELIRQCKAGTLCNDRALDSQT